MKKGMTIMTGGVVLITVLLAALYLYSASRLARLTQQNTGTHIYDRRYAFVSMDQSELWQAIYDSAKEQAELENVYLEWIGQDLVMNYTLEDCMKIAVASKADGILLNPDKSGEAEEMIASAAEAGIPVITLLDDKGENSRISYIGVNSYQMGELYGKQVLQCLKEEDNHIVVLTDQMTDNNNTNLLYSQMLQTIENGNNRNHTYDITLYQINTATSFDAEEDIRDLFIQADPVPDIMICLDLVSTECAAQALIDYNEVGKVTVIGSYASDTVYEALEKGILYSTISVDTGEIGQLCVTSMNEYHNLGNVSNYFNMRLEVINQKNVAKKRETEEPEEQPGLQAGRLIFGQAG